MKCFFGFRLNLANEVRKMTAYCILVVSLLATGCRHYYYQVSNPVEVMISNKNDIALKLIDNRRIFREGEEIFVHIPAQIMEDYLTSPKKLVVLSVSSSPSKLLKAAMYAAPDLKDISSSAGYISFRWEEMSVEEAVKRNIWFTGDMSDVKYHQTYHEYDDHVIVPYEVKDITYYITFYPRTLKSRLF
jgi:hypothetical protein